MLGPSTAEVGLQETRRPAELAIARQGRSADAVAQIEGRSIAPWLARSKVFDLIAGTARLATSLSSGAPEFSPGRTRMQAPRRRERARPRRRSGKTRCSGARPRILVVEDEVLIALGKSLQRRDLTLWDQRTRQPRLLTL